MEKIWHFKERYSALFRVECYNVFNHVNFAQFGAALLTQAAAAAVSKAYSQEWRFRLPHHRARPVLKPAIPVRLEVRVLTE